MTPAGLLRLLRARGQLEARRAWSADRLAAHQASALAALRAHALARSPYYRKLHRGLEGAPLAELPIVTKADLMAHFDELVTDPAIRLADVERHLERASATNRYLGRYRAAATGGTSGRRGVFLADPAEWNQVLASYARAYAWAGLEVGLTHPLRMAIVSSTAPTHQSSIVGATVRNPLVPTLRLDAVDPLPTTVAALNRFRPAALVGYASILGELAAEQAAGRLAIAPRAVFSASEVLTPDIRNAAAAAWGTDPYNVYAATETAGIASECPAHHLHTYADLVIAEAVDEAGQPVPPGDAGARLLVTVLFSRTQPLIRYELTDRVCFAPAPADDLGPFSTLIAEVEGRSEDLLQLAGPDGKPVRVHPNVFHAVLDASPGPWQVVAHADGLEVLVTTDPDGLEARLSAALRDAGATPRLELRQVPDIPRTALGKAPLIRTDPGGRMTDS
jgi:phenylacetate-coenzyme A ligase PaaK-like adenylate-forming protein